jgi:hypothetical protein
VAADGSSYTTTREFVTISGVQYTRTLIGRVVVGGSAWTYPTSGYTGVGDNSGQTTPWETETTFGSKDDAAQDYKNPGWWSLSGEDLMITYNGAFLMQSQGNCLGDQSFMDKLRTLEWDTTGSESKSGFMSAHPAHKCVRNTGASPSTSEAYEALGSTPNNIILQFGERNGVQDGNRDRVYITTDGVGSTGVDAPQGLGSFMTNGGGTVTAVNVGKNHDQAVSVDGAGNFYEVWVVKQGLYPASSGASAAAVGDPHLQNIHGERFDLMKPGTHVLINIPRGVGAEKSLLRVQADARHLGGQCADMYFQEVNVTGSWAEAKQYGGYHYSAKHSDVETPKWVVFGKVGLKVVHGRTNGGLSYLNVYVRHLGRAGFAVGGLLGEDDHEDVITPSANCGKSMSLLETGEGVRKTHSGLSVAEASLA